MKHLFAALFMALFLVAVHRPSGSGSLDAAVNLGSLSVSGPYLTDGSNYWISHNLLPAVLPVGTNFSWVNQGPASEAANGGALSMHVPPLNTGCTLYPCSAPNVRARTQAIGGSSTLTVAMQCTEHFWPYYLCGIGFYESATGKLETVSIGTGNDVAVSSFISVTKFTNVTTYSSTPNQTGAIFPNTMLYRLVKSAGNLSFQWSMDGANWLTLWTEAQNAFFTTAPDQWFYFIDNEFGTRTQSATDGYATLLSWQAQ